MLTLAKACLADGKKILMSAYKVPSIKNANGWMVFQYPVEAILLCRAYQGEPGQEGSALTLKQAQDRLVPGTLLTVFGFGERKQWVQPDALGFIYVLEDTMGLHGLDAVEQFMLKVRHINHPAPVRSDGQVSEEVEQQRLLARVTEVTQGPPGEEMDYAEILE